MNIIITGGNGDIAQTFVRKNPPRLNIIAPSKDELDVTNEKSVKTFFETYKTAVLINNAGYISPSNTKESDTTIWKRHLDINLYGAYLCSKYAILNGCKTIINIGSTSGWEGKKDWGAYCASKAGLVSLTETLYHEGINSYSLNIGRTATKMRKSLFPGEDSKQLMEPERVITFLLEIIEGTFESGSHLILTKDNLFVQSYRICPK